MYDVHIRNGEIFIERWNPEIRQNEERRSGTQSLIPLLGFKVDIEDTTFEQFMELIARDQKEMDKIFESYTYGHKLEQFIEECRLPPGNKDNLQYVEVYWGAEVSRFSEDKKPELEIFPGFHGWGPWDSLPGMEGESPREGGYAIEYSPIYEYKMLPLKLDTEVQVWDMDNPKNVPEKWYKPFTVYDVVRAILFEITWSGDISNRARRVDEMRERMDEAKKVMGMSKVELEEHEKENDISEEELLGGSEEGDPNLN